MSLDFTIREGSIIIFSEKNKNNQGTQKSVNMTPFL